MKIFSRRGTANEWPTMKEGAIGGAAIWMFFLAILAFTSWTLKNKLFSCLAIICIGVIATVMCIVGLIDFALSRFLDTYDED